MIEIGKEKCDLTQWQEKNKNYYCCGNVYVFLNNDVYFCTL